MRVLNFLVQNQELILGLLGLLFAVIRLTKWGRSNQEVLIKVAEAIEAIGDKQLKAEIAAKLETATAGERDAMDHAVSVVDTAKTPKSGYERVLLDLSRALMPAARETK